MEALQAAGISDFSPDGPVYVDRQPRKKPKEGESPQPALAELVHAMRQGGVVMVAGLDVLGPTRAAIIAAMKAIGARGGSVRDLEAQQDISCEPEVVGAAEAIERAVERLYVERAKAARAAKKKLGPGAQGGRRPRWTEAQYAKAKPFYFDLSLSNAAVEKHGGIPYRTLYRKFGERGSPQAVKRRQKQ